MNGHSAQAGFFGVQIPWARIAELAPSLHVVQLVDPDDDDADEPEYVVGMAVFLDAQNRVIKVQELFTGTLTQTSVFPRDVVRYALLNNAAAVIFAHNHPSGLAEPSRADELLTQALKQALALVDVRVLDHFIVGAGAAMSFAERGLL